VAELFAGADPGLDPSRDAVVLGAPGPDGQTRAERVTVGGRAVVDGGRLVTGDIEEIRRHAREEAPRLWRRMAEL
jgi:hypothetical protein